MPVARASDLRRIRRGERVGVFDGKFKKFPDSIIKNRSI